MRRNFEKSRCRCRRCIAKRRSRFLVSSGACIAIAGGCYILVGHLKPGAPDSLSMAKPSAEEPDLDASGIPRGTPLLRTLAQPESTPANLAEDSFLTASPVLTPNLAPLGRGRVTLRSSNPIEGAPMPHTNGWQTVPLGDALESSSVVNVRGGSQPDGAKVAAMPAESSPGPAFGESTVHPAAETRARKDGEDGLTAYSSDPYKLLPRWLREMQQKSDKTSFNGNALVLQNPGNAGGGSTSAARSTVLVTAPKSEIPQSETPGAATDRVAPAAAVSPAFSTAETDVVEAAETEKERTHEDVALVKAAELDEQLKPQPNKTDLASQSKPNKAVVSEIAGNARAAVSEIAGNAQAAVSKIAGNAQAVVSEIAGNAQAVVSEIARNVQAVGTETKVQDPKPAPSSARLSANLQSNSETPEAANTPAETHAVGTAETARERTHEDVALIKAPELDQQLEPQPKKTDVASQRKPNKPLVSENAGNARAVVSETKEQVPKPAATSARLIARPESNAALPAEERGNPRGYITVESKPEAPRNPGAENLHPKPQEHSLRAQNHLLVRDRPAPVQEYPSKTPDSPSEPKEKSGDLRNFASAFLQTGQNGNIAEQHRFYADSVHFYGEGDLSWAGVEAATRRHRQERQNKRYGTEGTAAVKGPVDGGFYVVEQPVSWTRAEGSRLVRGRSVLRLRVVPTNRGDWKITSIDEVRQ